ncbi:hypothetical protein BH11ARM1_BH11ARM1_08640 [soil metagenome]
MKVGGDDMGPLFDKWVMNPGELPVEEVLAKVGLTVTTTDKKVVVSENAQATPEQIALRNGWYWGKKSKPMVLQGKL